MKRFALFIILVALTPGSLLAQRDLQEIPDTDPEVELRSFVVADGFEVNLFASEPQIASPIQMNFDAHGRLWVASSEVYPQIKPGQIANDKIIILEDADRDGVAEQSTVFADGLLIPTGVLPGDGGVYVANSTELIHLKDTDNDGKADVRRVVLSGFGTEDTHHLLHTLRWGYDGLMYMNQSIYIHTHVETPHGVRRLNAGGIWQFRPETMELEVYCRGFVNAWGRHFNNWGADFATDGAYTQGINYIFPGSVFFTAANSRRTVQGLNPGSPKHCGLELVSGSHLPSDWQDNAITNDFRAHRVCRFVLEEDGSGFASRQAEDVIRSTHGAFRPIDVKMGPDGAIYVADWYNPIIQHGEVDFRDPRRDHVHGRIWRITKTDSPLIEPKNFEKMPIGRLLDTLKSSQKWERTQAKLQLKSRDRDDVMTKLAKWVKQAKSDRHRLEGLWTYQAINHCNNALIHRLAKSKNHNVRAAAIRVSAHFTDELDNQLGLLEQAVTDSHPRVRLEAVRALSEIQSADAMRIGLAATRKPMDEFLDFAIWQLANDLESQWIPALNDAESEIKEDAIQHPASWAFAMAAVGSRDVAGPAIDILPDNDPETAKRLVQIAAERGDGDLLKSLLDSILPGGERHGKANQVKPILASFANAMETRKTKPSGELGSIEQLYEDSDPTVVALAFDVAIAWNAASQEKVLKAASDIQKDAAIRLAAIRALGRLPGKDSRQSLIAIIHDGDQPESIRLSAIESLAKIGLQQAADATAKLLAKDQSISIVGAMGPFLSRKQGPNVLAVALKGTEIPRDRAQLAMRAARGNSQNADKLIAAIQKAGGLANGIRQWTDEQLAQITQQAKAAGDPHSGEVIYRRENLACIKCHAIGEVGGKVGPNLISLGASAQMDYIVESLLRPSAKVKENFHSQVILTDEGKVVTGISVREDDNVLVLRDAEDREVVIPQDSIDDRTEGRSLMPEGSVDLLTKQEIIDLASFLSKLGKHEDFLTTSRRYVRRWNNLVWSNETNRVINRSSNNTVAIGNDNFKWKPVLSKVDGSLPIDDSIVFQPHRNQPRFTYLQARLDVTKAGTFQFDFEESRGLSIWIDAKPIPPKKQIQVDWKPGKHTITIAVNLDEREQPIRAEWLQEQSSGRLEVLAN